MYITNKIKGWNIFDRCLRYRNTKTGPRIPSFIKKYDFTCGLAPGSRVYIEHWRGTWHTLRWRGHCHPVYTTQQLLCPPDLGEYGFDLEADCPGSVEVSYSVGLYQGLKAPVRLVIFFVLADPALELIAISLTFLRGKDVLHHRKSLILQLR